MANVHESGNSVVVDVNPDVVQQDADKQLNSDQYHQATKGDFHAFEQIDAGSLTQLVTRVDKNTILHICITAATPHYRKKTFRNTENNESVNFVKEILAKCKQLLWQPNEKGETILHIAARHGHHEIVRVLLTEDKEARDSGQADNRPRLLEMENEVGDTALHEAVRYSHLQVVKILTNIEDCDYIYGQNSDGETPLYIAAEKGARKIVVEILRKSLAYEGPDERTALHAAVLCNDKELVKLLLGKLKELTRKGDKLGWTPLHYAAHSGCLPIVKLLLKEDKDAAYIADRKQKKTALHIAASRSKANVVNELMLACPDCFEQVDKNGRNVLHFAVETKERDKEKILRLVLQNECFSNLINAKDDLGNTPLHYATASPDSVRSLIFHPKWNAQVFNKKNLSPLDIASAQSDPTLRSIFISLYLKSVDDRRNLRITDEDEGKERGEIKDQDGINEDELDEETKHNRKKDLMTVFTFLRDSNLVVVTLVATVTFAAGLTLPGGYISENGSNQGSAALIRKPALKVFVFSNTIAFALSCSVVFICSCRRHMSTEAKPQSETFLTGTEVDISISTFGTITAVIAMVIAFLSGTCAVLAPDPLLVTGLCLYSACIFVSLFFERYVCMWSFPLMFRINRLLRGN